MSRNLRDFLPPDYVTPDVAAYRDPASPEAMRARRGPDLRLLPIAAATWATVAATIAYRDATAILVCLALLLVRRARPAGVVAGIAAALAWLKILHVDRDPLRHARTFAGSASIAESPRTLDGGGLMLPVDLPLGQVPLFLSAEQASDADLAALHPGATVQIAATLSESGRPGIVPLIARATQPISVDEPAYGLWALTAHLRQSFREATDLLPWDAGQLVPGLVLGDTTGQQAQLREDFLHTGLSHLTAVSGANCALLASAVMLVAAWCGAPQRRQPVWAAAVLLGFVCLVGPEASVLRAAVMGFVGLAAVASSRWGDVFASLNAAIIVLLLTAPSLALSYGFALSVTATLGIVAAAPWLSRLALEKLWIARKQPPRRWQVIAVRSLTVAVVADLTTAPLIVHMTGQAPMAAVLANLLVAPAVPAVTLLGILAVPAAAIAAPLGTVIAAPTAVPAAWIITIARTFAGAPQLNIQGGTLAMGALLAILALLLASIAFPRRITQLRWGWLLTSVAIVIAVRGGVVSTTNPARDGPSAWSDEQLAGRSVVDVATEREALAATDLPPDRTVLRVAECATHDRPALTPAGIPVIYNCP